MYETGRRFSLKEMMALETHVNQWCLLMAYYLKKCLRKLFPRYTSGLEIGFGAPNIESKQQLPYQRGTDWKSLHCKLTLPVPRNGT